MSEENLKTDEIIMVKLEDEDDYEMELGQERLLRKILPKPDNWQPDQPVWSPSTGQHGQNTLMTNSKRILHDVLKVFL